MSDHVPNEWYCLKCGNRTHSKEIRPYCVCNSEKQMVPFSWRRYGPEQNQKIFDLQENIVKLNSEIKYLQQRVFKVAYWVAAISGTAGIIIGYLIWR